MKKTDKPAVQFAHLKKLNYITNEQTTTVEIDFLMDESDVVPKLWVRPLSPILNNELTEFLLANPDIDKKYGDAQAATIFDKKTKDKSVKKAVAEHDASIAFCSVFVEHIAKFVVVGWENIIDSDNNPIPFTIETFKSLYNAIGNELYQTVLINKIINTALSELNFIESNADLRELAAVDKAGKKS